MGLGSLLDSLFRGKAGAAADEKSGSGRREPVSDETPAPRETADEDNADILLLREEILDSRGRLCGYRFSMKPMNEQRVLSEAQFFKALQSASIPAFAQKRMALIPIHPDSIVFGRHLSLAAPRTTFLLDARHPAGNGLQGYLNAIRGSGCQTALKGVSLSSEETSLFEETDIVFLDLADFSLPQFQKLAQDIRSAAPQVALGVESVQSWAEQRMCAAWGFEYFMGEFLATTDEQEQENGIDQGRLTAIELLNLLRGDAEVAELAEVAKRDPGVTFQLLRMANSPASGLIEPVSTLEQAILVLGREQLYRWLTVSMFRIGKASGRNEALLEIALTRARLLETLEAPALSGRDRDELFLVGMLSLFDVLLAMPMRKVLKKMRLSEAVLDVLLHSAGPHGKYLMLALAIEKGRASQAASLAADLGIDPNTLESASQAAFSWAQEALSLDGMG